MRRRGSRRDGGSSSCVLAGRQAQAFRQHCRIFGNPPPRPLSITLEIFWKLRPRALQRLARFVQTPEICQGSDEVLMSPGVFRLYPDHLTQRFQCGSEIS